MLVDTISDSWREILLFLLLSFFPEFVYLFLCILGYPLSPLLFISLKYFCIPNHIKSTYLLFIYLRAVYQMLIYTPLRYLKFTRLLPACSVCLHVSG